MLAGLGGNQRGGEVHRLEGGRHRQDTSTWTPAQGKGHLGAPSATKVGMQEAPSDI